MIRKLSITFILALLVSLFAAVPASAAKSYFAERFDVQIDLQENGSAIVTETVEFHFSGDPFTFAFREISGDNTDGITFLDATMDGLPMPQGTEAGQVEVEAGNPLKVRWHFPPTSEAARVFTVRYRVDGIIRKGDADVLMWRAIPEDHDYAINRSTIVLTFPPDAMPLEQPVLDGDHVATAEGGRVVLTASGLAEDEDLILTARFPLNSLAQTPPQWQVQQERVEAATTKALPFGLLAGIVTLLAGGLGLFIHARSNARELSVSPAVSVANPPSDLPPALVGKLTGQHHTFMGAVFDLAQRGVLEVGAEKGSWGMTSHVLIRREYVAPLTSYERELLDLLFKPGESQVDMSEIGTRFNMKSHRFDELLEQELIQRSWFDLERKRKKTILTAVGISVMLLSVAIGFISMAVGGLAARETPAWIALLAVLIGMSAGAFLISIPVMIYAAAFSTLTPAGEDQAARWKGFAEYLKQVSKGKEPAIRPDYFERYLAYATVFGLGSSWAKYFEGLGGVPLPIWFHAAAGSHANFGAIVAVMSASDSAGVSGGVSGAGGASGGGSSGAG